MRDVVNGVMSMIVPTHETMHNSGARACVLVIGRLRRRNAIKTYSVRVVRFSEMGWI
jgi:hypothetical protein